MEEGMDGESDVFFQVRQYFYLGNYTSTLNELDQLEPVNSTENILKDILLMRCLIAMNRSNEVLHMLNRMNSQDTEYKAIHALALYHHGEEQKALKKLDELLQDSMVPNEEPMLGQSLVLLIAGMLYFREGNHNEALRLLHSSQSMECHALIIQIYLSINRPELALKELDVMKRIDEDSLLTCLAEAWIFLSSSPERTQDAMYIFQELIEKYDSVSRFLNAKSLCYMKLGKFTQAEDYLQEAMTYDDNQEETLANLITCLSHTTESDTATTTQDIINSGNFLSHRSTTKKGGYLIIMTSLRDTMAHIQNACVPINDKEKLTIKPNLFIEIDPILQ